MGVKRSVEQLASSVSEKEKTYGLKTHDYKSVWKFACVVKGHPVLFYALADWLFDGNQLIVVKGNHDLEWHWQLVRNYLRLVMSDCAAERNGKSIPSALTEIVLPNLSFVGNAVVIDKEVYVEHGHRYDKFSHVLGKPTLGDGGEELNIPFGSFFNRYLVNKLELVYPFFDNVRPKQNIIHMLMRERFFLGIKVLFKYVPFAIRMVPKGYIRYMLKPLVFYAIAFFVPLGIIIALWGQRLGFWLVSAANPDPITSVWDILKSQAGGFIKDTAVMFLSYLFSRIVSRVQLEEKEYLMEPAMKLLHDNPNVRCVTMGHTHNPEQCIENGRWYINSSTWVPVIESSSAQVREDKTYAVLHLDRDGAGSLRVHPLQRWNDDAGRLESLVIVDRK